MKIDIARLKDGVTETFEETIESRQLDLDTSEITFSSPITIVTNATKDIGAVNTSTHVNAVLSCVCSRCLERYKTVLDRIIEQAYPLDVGTIDIRSEIREEVILGYPVKLLCKETCRGLCPYCGKNLNNDTCTCNEEHKGDDTITVK